MLIILIVILLHSISCRFAYRRINRLSKFSSTLRLTSKLFAPNLHTIMSIVATSTSFNFPHPELTPIVGPPTYLTISQLKRELYANASSVHTILGTGQHGFAVLVLGETAYNALDDNAALNWANPAHPGNEPNFVANATARQIAVATQNYERDLKSFTLFNEVENALKRQLLAAIDPTYVCSLQNALYGYANVTTLQLIEHLVTNYAELDQDQLTKNMDTLEVPWEPTESMEPLWLRAVFAQQVATAGGEPITETTLLRIYRKVLTDTGVFSLDLRDWDKKPAAEKTWANFQVFFTAANKERAKKVTAGSFQGHAFRAIGGNNNSRPSTRPLKVPPVHRLPMPTSRRLASTTAGRMAWAPTPTTQVYRAPTKRPDTRKTPPSST